MSSTVYLPEGHWTSLWDQAQYEGGKVITIQTPINRIPAFYNAEAISANVQQIFSEITT
jgi:alpha-glucosidase (family GH31 glycosyl hydrolase)